MASTKLRASLLTHVRQHLEDRPGVYRMLGESGEVLYVGKSKRLRRRLLSYFRARGRRSKAARILRNAHAIEWEYHPTEFAALLRELRLIKQYRPRFNVSLARDETPRGYLALTNEPVPALRVVMRSDDPQAALLYGPFRRLNDLADAARALADATGVRDCAGAAGSCLRMELGTCACPSRRSPPPSALPPRSPATGGRRLREERGGGRESREYAERVALARDFLAGRSDVPLTTLRSRMMAAAEGLQFERAAAIKAKLEKLAWLRGRLARFHADVDRLTFMYSPVGHGGEERLYLLRRGTVRAELGRPDGAERGQLAEPDALAATARRVFEGPDPRGRDIPTHDLDELYLVTAWFRKYPEELDRTRKWTGE
jgi:excinuclease ABC subunit C